MAECKVTMWNSSGIRAGTASTPAKMALFDNENPKADYTIAAFVETHHRNTDDFPEYITEHAEHFNIVHTPTPPTHTHSGIIIMISKAYDIIQQNTVIPGRLINVHISHKTTKHEYNLSVYYGTHLEHLTVNEMEEICNNFKTIHNIQNNNIIIGDFNFADHNLDKGKGRNGKDRSFTAYWDTFKKDCNMTDPYRKKFPKRKIFSFIGPQGKSRGDRVYINEESLNNITDIRYINHNFNTAHKIMKFTLKDQKTQGPGYWKMNSSILNDTAYVKMIEQTVERMEQNLYEVSIHPGTGDWKRFS